MEVGNILQVPSGYSSPSCGILLVSAEVRKLWELCQIISFSLNYLLMSNLNKQTIKKVLNPNALLPKMT